MKQEHKDLTPTELALLTWYKPDNPLYRNPEHPTIKLAGEIGELLDLYGKHKYKPGFDWMVCKSCKNLDPKHFNHRFVPLVLDELGDIWYYLRILAWIYDCKLKISDKQYMDYSILGSLQIMYSSASIILRVLNWDDTSNKGKRIDNLLTIYKHLNLILEHLDTTIEELKLLNYYKLNSEETNHGWKDAR